MTDLHKKIAEPLCFNCRNNKLRICEQQKEIVETRVALKSLLYFVENMRCPQTIADVALLALQAKGPIDGAHKALGEDQ